MINKSIANNERKYLYDTIALIIKTIEKNNKKIKEYDKDNLQMQEYMWENIKEMGTSIL